MYSGCLLGIFILSLTGDMYGRKRLILVNKILILVGVILTGLSNSLWIGGFGMFLCMIGAKNSINLVYIYIP